MHERWPLEANWRRGATAAAAAAATVFTSAALRMPLEKAAHRLRWAS